MTAAALRLVPAPQPESTVPLRLPAPLVKRIDERAERKQLTRLELLEALFPDAAEPTDPAWRARLVGLYTDADERAEREVLGWLLCGGQVPPRMLRAEHFASRFNRLLFAACAAVRAADDCVHPVRVITCLRAFGHRGPSIAAEMSALMRESLEFTEPPSFQSFLERAELRLRVMRLEREADELRKGLR